MSMEETREIFSHRVTAGRRTYFFDVKQSRDGTRYLVISESQVCDTGYRHHRVMVFEEHVQQFAQGFEQALTFLRTRNRP